jgi:dTDP-4-amino-4,6-dideoxygalactose transaminase
VLLSNRETRDRFREKLKVNGVQTTWYPALQTFAEYRQLSAANNLRRANEAGDRHCALPLSATMDEAAVELVVDTVRSALAS